MKTFADRADHAPTAEEWMTHLEERLHVLELKVKKMSEEGISIDEVQRLRDLEHRKAKKK